MNKNIKDVMPSNISKWHDTILNYYFHTCNESNINYLRHLFAKIMKIHKSRIQAKQQKL